MHMANAIVKHRILILVLCILLLIPAAIGMQNTRINYDMLDYLPEDMDTVIGQNALMDDFGKGAFSLIIVEDMPLRDVAVLKEKLQQVKHVDTVLWYDSVADLSIPMEMLPKKLYDAFNTENATMMAVFFDSATSADVTMDAIREIRAIAPPRPEWSALPVRQSRRFQAWRGWPGRWYRSGSRQRRNR